MRIAMISAGSGPRFYCENCARDDGLFRALAARGHVVIPVPLYLPSAWPTVSPVFFGAPALYLRHKWGWLRRVPRWATGLLDTGPALRLASRLSGATTAASLGGLTLSLLRGEGGGQAAELDRMLQWLREQRPDVLHLSTALLIGMARRLREIGPVVCMLQDEHTWLDDLGARSAAAWDLLRERTPDVDLFLPVSRWYARFMTGRLDLPAAKVAVVPAGVETDGCVRPAATPPTEHRVVGYLSRITERMGAGVLVDAFITLAPRYPGLGLRLAGGSTASDAPLLRSIRRRLSRAGLAARTEIVRAGTRAERARFLSGLTVLSVPAREATAFGVFLLEAMAAGVPVVQPRVGGFPEVVEDTGGGMLYEGDAGELAKALGALLEDPQRARRMGRAGYEAVRERYTTARMAEHLESALAGVVRV